MAPKRHLPEKHNSLLEPEWTPPLSTLIERRRLGSTDLRVKPGEGAMSPSGQGVFDYAHLRVPLPPTLEGTGIFQRQRNGRYPESYFLMRRSEDGYVSATGMFKAAYPWASLEEEQTERKHHKKLSEEEEEVAGNVWITPKESLKLADEYNMRAWIVALLDPEAIEKGTKDKDKTEISTPPTFAIPKKYADDPSFGTNSVRGKRTLRSASPEKTQLPPATPSERKIASPRKKKTAKSSVASAQAEEASNDLAKLTQDGEAIANGISEDKVRVEVDESVEQVGDVETTHTTVRVEMPAGSPELPLPESAEEMVAKARAMVEEARELDGRPRSSRGKRKADEIEEEVDEDGEVVAVHPASKRTKLRVEEQLKKEKIKTRALIGIAATFVVGSVIPYFV